MTMPAHRDWSGSERGEESDSEPTPWEHAIFAAPYRDRLPDGTLGAEYLPVSHHTGRSLSQSAAEAEYRASIDAVPSRLAGGSGGFVDHERLPKRRLRSDQHAENKAAEAARVRRYVARHSSTMPRSLLLTAIAYWEHSQSVAQTGAALHVTRNAAWQYIQRVRRLLRDATVAKP